MVGLLSIIAVGFFLGMRHATDPDHVIAISTIVTHEPSVKRSAVIGAAWGVGHTLTILAVGGAIILFKVTLPPRLGLAMEMAVAVMLIWLGIKNLGPLLTWNAERSGAIEQTKSPERAHYHANGDFIHAHHHASPQAHAHDPKTSPVVKMDRRFGRYGLYQLLRPLIIGVIHGLAGSAAIALLVLSTISNLSWAVAYLFVFGLGTVLGMMLITLTLGSTFVYGQKRFARLGRNLTVAAGMLSLVFGLLIAYEIAFVNGLFSSHVHWVPR
jgi:cytochrome c biogenesis protein CcdA